MPNKKLSGDEEGSSAVEVEVERAGGLTHGTIAGTRMVYTVEFERHFYCIVSYIRVGSVGVGTKFEVENVER